MAYFNEADYCDTCGRKFADIVDEQIDYPREPFMYNGDALCEECFVNETKQGGWQ